MPPHDSRTQLRHRSRRPAPRDRLRRDRHGHRRRRQPRRHQHRLADRRFELRRYGVYRLQYRFKGSSLALGGKVTEAIRIRRTIRFG
jgi:hypothetical protein